LWNGSAALSRSHCHQSCWLNPKIEEGEFMSSKSLSYSGALGFGWDGMKSNFWFFTGILIVSFVISVPGEILGQLEKNCPESIQPFMAFVILPATLITTVLEIIVGIGVIKITLSFCDGIKPKFSTLFNPLGCFWRYIGTGLLYTLILFGTAIVCILPFALLTNVMHSPCFALSIFAVIYILLIILAIKLSLCFYFVIDKGLGPIKALKASSMATTGVMWALFVFWILCFLINLLGALCFIIGLFATVPITLLAMADAYRQLSEQTPELAELGIGGPKVQPSGGNVGGSTQPFAGIQPNPIIPSIQSIQSGPDIRHGQDVQTSPSVQLTQGVQPGKVIRPVPAIRRGEEKKDDKSLLFWVTVLIIVSVAFAAGIGYRFWLKSKEKIVVSTNGDKVSVKEVSLTAILYSKDKPLAMIEGKIAKEGDIIDGIKVVKINKNDVEFEKDGATWTQRPAGKTK
jgi:hypothetical protein